MKRRARGKGTIIAEGFSVTGDVKGDGPVLVAGNVKGNADIQGLIELSQTATWEGDVHADDVIVGGSLKGHVFARDELAVTASARISGNVSSRSISIEQGATLNGAMHVTRDGTVDEQAARRNDDASADTAETSEETSDLGDDVTDGQYSQSGL